MKAFCVQHKHKAYQMCKREQINRRLVNAEHNSPILNTKYGRSSYRIHFSSDAVGPVEKNITSSSNKK